MKAFPWILAGVSIGAAVAYIVMNAPEPQYATGSDDVEDAARNTSTWGTKQRVSGTGSSLVGKVKEGFGKVTGDQDTESEGLVDQAAGTVKDTVGKVAEAAGQTIHDLNR
jgi:uncharacterized protein YjbJ (UPF0337 family)